MKTYQKRFVLFVSILIVVVAFFVFKKVYHNPPDRTYIPFNDENTIKVEHLMAKATNTTLSLIGQRPYNDFVQHKSNKECSVNTDCKAISYADRCVIGGTTYDPVNLKAAEQFFAVMKEDSESYIAYGNSSCFAEPSFYTPIGLLCYKGECTNMLQDFDFRVIFPAPCFQNKECIEKYQMLK